MLNKKYIDKLCELMVKNNVDAMMIGPSVDLKFLTDFNPSICERFQAFFILSNGECFHISPQLYLEAVSYTHLRAHETRHDLVCRLLLEKKKNKKINIITDV